MTHYYSRHLFFTLLVSVLLLSWKTDIDVNGRFYVESRVISSDSSTCCFELLIMVHEVGQVNLSDVIRAYGIVQQGPCCSNLPGTIEDGVLIKDNPLSPQSINELLALHPKLQRMIDRSVNDAIRDFQAQRETVVTGIKVPQEAVFNLLDVEIQCSEGAKVTLLITDFKGTILQSFDPITLEVGSNYKQLQLIGLASGFYFLKVRQENSTKLVPFEVR